jgi:3-deoxy-D-manno-octulosonic-acid transferase
MGVMLDLIYLLAALIASPYVLFRMATSARWRAGFVERLGFVPRRGGARRCVWVHCVSVGEVGAARTMIDLLRAEHPDWDVRVSTTTNTGQKVARERYGPAAFYFPLDCTPALLNAFGRVRPDLIVLMELEVWPNFLRLAHRRGIPVVIVNGRMREERVASYRRLRFLFGPALAPDTRNLFCVQNETYRDRFIRAGFPAAKVRITGTMKYDAVRTTPAPERTAALRTALGLGPEERLWVAGCTWPGEEAMCLRAHRRLMEKAPGLRLAIAPRHVERAEEVRREIETAGFGCRRRSAECGPTGPQAVCLLDSVGELSYLYEMADFAFVGKSLTAQGGHNVLEPAALGVAPVFGPRTDNFSDEAQLLLDARAALRVRDEAELTEALLTLLQAPELRREMAERGRAALTERRGASRRHVDVLRQVLDGPAA